MPLLLLCCQGRAEHLTPGEPCHSWPVDMGNTPLSFSMKTNPLTTFQVPCYHLASSSLAQLHLQPSHHDLS